MAIALLAGTLLAIAGFLLTSVQGFVVATHLAQSDPMVRFLVTKHVAYAIPTVLLSLFSQSMVIFFFIGTGRLVKDEIAGYSEPERRAVLDALRDFKRRTSPPATFALLSAIGVFVLGGAAHVKALPSWTHLTAALTAVATHLWALGAEFSAFVENGRLMTDPAAYVRALPAGALAPRTASPRPRP